MGLVSAPLSMTKTNCVALGQFLSPQFTSDGHCYCRNNKKWNLHLSLAFFRQYIWQTNKWIAEVSIQICWTTSIITISPFRPDKKLECSYLLVGCNLFPCGSTRSVKSFIPDTEQFLFGHFVGWFILKLLKQVTETAIIINTWLE